MIKAINNWRVQKILKTLNYKKLSIHKWIHYTTHIISFLWYSNILNMVLKRIKSVTVFNYWLTLCLSCKIKLINPLNYGALTCILYSKNTLKVFIFKVLPELSKSILNFSMLNSHQKQMNHTFKSLDLPLNKTDKKISKYKNAFQELKTS